MAATEFLNANALTQKEWSKTRLKWMLANSILSKFMGTPEEGKPIMIDSALEGKPKKGDTVTYSIIPALTGAGIGDDGTLEGSEEAVDQWNMPVTLHERGNGVVIKGLMSDKRTAFNILKDGFNLLAPWSMEQEENDLIYALCGIGNQGGYVGEGATDIETVNEKAPSANRIYFGGQTVAGVETWVATDALIGAAGASDPLNYLFGSRVISKIKRQAQLATPKIPPVMWNGKPYYMMLIHPLQTKALRQETFTNGFMDLQKYANTRSPTNPVFERQGEGEDRMWDGLIGVYDDVLIYESERLPTRVAAEYFNDNTDAVHSRIVSGTYRLARCLLLGANAAIILYGQHWTRHTKQFDYDRKTGVAMDAMYGVSKTQFRDPGLNQSANDAQEDYGVIACDTAVQEG